VPANVLPGPEYVPVTGVHQLALLSKALNASWAESYVEEAIETNISPLMVTVSAVIPLDGKRVEELAK
jgi:hypothetical protein